MSPNPLLTTLGSVVLVLFSGTATAVIARAILMSPIVGYIILGIAARATGFEAFDPATIDTLAQLGVVFLLFDIGYLAVERDTVRLQAAIADGYEVEYGDRVVECRARSRPHVAGTSFQQPSCPRLIRAVDQRIALQVARLGDGSTMLQPRGRAHRDQVVSSILADDASDGSPPVVVVMAHRPPKPTPSGTLLLFTLPRATGRCRIGATMD